MATRSQSWFGDDKLLGNERMVRSGRVRLRTSEPPYWWEGTLILTTDRLFFLPSTENPLIDSVAFWLADITGASRDGARRFRIDSGDTHATFLALGIPGRGEQRWLAAIASARATASPRAAFDGPRRAVS
jgi:hypothetical protein